MKPSLLFLAILLLFVFNSCQNNSANYEMAADDFQRDSTSITDSIGKEIKLVKTAGIHFKVRDVEQSTRSLSTLAQKYGGMIHYHFFQSLEGDKKELKLSEDSLLLIATTTPQADLTIRVPSQHLETFLFEVTDIGYFTGSREMKIDDKSLAYLENVWKQKAREEVLSQTSPVRKTTAAAQQTIQLKDEAIQQAISNKAIDADVAYSTVQMHLYQNALVRKEVIANDDITAYNLSFGERLGNALYTGWEAFLDVVLVLSHLWMFILFGVLGFFIYRL